MRGGSMAHADAAPDDDHAVDDVVAAEHVLDVLAEWGVEYIFACPGSTEAAFLDELSRRDDMSLILTTHESAAVSAADGYGRATGKVSVAYLHANVGLTNGLTNLYAAALGYSPVILLNGMKSSGVQARSGFTTAPNMRMFVDQYVKASWETIDADEVVDDLQRALVRAVASPRGPVWLGLRQDVLESTPRCSMHAAPAPAASVLPSGIITSPPAELLAQAARLLSEAERPVLVAGGATYDAAFWEALHYLAQRARATIMLAERRAVECFAVPHTDPLFGGLLGDGDDLLAQADVVFFVGCKISHPFETSKTALPDDLVVIHSHDDPRVMDGEQRVDVPLVGDPLTTLRGVTDLLRPATVDGGDATSRTVPDPGDVEPQAHEGSDEAGAAHRDESATLRETGCLRAADVVDALAEAFPGATFLGDATTAGLELQRQLPRSEGQTYLTSASGALGWGMGAALGYALARPHQTTVCVIGDGVFQFGLPALWTASYYRIDVTYVVLNNQRYAAVGAALARYRRKFRRPQGVDIAIDISGVEVADVAKAFGIAAVRVSTTDELHAALTPLQGGPRLIEVMTDPYDFGP